ncbi:mechanosensitive ion channel [Candidatus Woesearchaeota archaeon]|jgi:small-conductance mechanosensitive channel|nr:mechanosensitive ion channel [Candidatus Woesearchaeota archaeon]
MADIGTINESLLTSTDRTAYLYSKVQPIFTEIVVAVIILLIGLIIGKILGRVVQKLLNSLELNKLIRKSTGMRVRIEEFFAKITSYFIFFIAIIMALDVLNLTSSIIYIVSIMIIAIIVISIAISIKDFIPNMIAGLYIHKKNMFKEGKKIKIDGLEGTIEQINLTEIKLITKKGDIVFIPNSLLTKKEVVVKK